MRLHAVNNFRKHVSKCPNRLAIGTLVEVSRPDRATKRGAVITDDGFEVYIDCGAYKTRVRRSNWKVDCASTG